MTAPDVATRTTSIRLLDERELVRRVRTGDERALESIFRSHHTELWRFARSIVRESAVAEEIVQEVFLSVWRERADWEPSGAVRGWLFAAVRHHALNHLRHERVVARFEEKLVARGAAADAPMADASVGMSAPLPDAQADLEARELDATVDRAIAALPERRRLAMTLRWKHGLSAAEIAAVLRTTPASVRVLLTRARQELGELLDLAR